MAAGAFHVCGPSPTSRRVPGLHFRLRASNRQIPNAEFHRSHLTPPDIPPRHTPVPRWGRNSGTPAHQASAPPWSHILGAPTASQPCKVWSWKTRLSDSFLPVQSRLLVPLLVTALKQVSCAHVCVCDRAGVHSTQAGNS